MRFLFDYGREKLLLELPEERVRAVLAPAEVAGVEDLAAATRRSLQAPLASPPLGELLKGAGTALIVTVDYTRPSPAAMLLPVLDLCEEQGVRATVCIAGGRHRLMLDEEVRNHLGGLVVQRAGVVQHDASDRAVCRHVGRTRRGTEITVNRIVFEHDVVIGVGFIEPSYLCGWSGGN